MFSKGWGEGWLEGKAGRGNGLQLLDQDARLSETGKLTKKPAASKVQARVMQGEPILKYESLSQ